MRSVLRFRTRRLTSVGSPSLTFYRNIAIISPIVHKNSSKPNKTLLLENPLFGAFCIRFKITLFIFSPVLVCKILCKQPVRNPMRTRSNDTVPFRPGRWFGYSVQFGCSGFRGNIKRLLPSTSGTTLTVHVYNSRSG